METKLLSEILQSRWPTIFSALLLPAFWAVFAQAHLNAFLITHEWPLLVFFFSETMASVFYIIRSDPKTVSVVPLDWLIAILGTFAPLLLRPADWGILPQASLGITAGAIIQLLALISLNRSIALVPAKRVIKTAWMYRIVRHPMYASYCLIFTGYVLTHTTLTNLVIYAMTVGLLCVRIFREEKHLALDPVYRQYMLKVRYRIVPYLF